MMSTYSSRCGSNLSFAGILFFFFFDSIQEVFSLALYSAAAYLSFY